MRIRPSRCLTLGEVMVMVEVLEDQEGLTEVDTQRCL